MSVAETTTKPVHELLQRSHCYRATGFDVGLIKWCFRKLENMIKCLRINSRKVTWCLDWRNSRVTACGRGCFCLVRLKHNSCLLTMFLMFPIPARLLSTSLGIWLFCSASLIFRSSFTVMLFWFCCLCCSAMDRRCSALKTVQKFSVEWWTLLTLNVHYLGDIKEATSQTSQLLAG